MQPRSLPGPRHVAWIREQGLSDFWSANPAAQYLSRVAASKPLKKCQKSGIFLVRDRIALCDRNFGALPPIASHFGRTPTEHVAPPH